MAIYSGYYIKEISFNIDSVKNIHINTNSIFEMFDALYILTENGFELFSGEVYYFDGTNWINITTS